MRMTKHIRRTTQGGFTLGEMVGVVAIVTIVTVLAYPAMKTFSARNDGASAATRITRTINRARDQATEPRLYYRFLGDGGQRTRWPGRFLRKPTGAMPLAIDNHER